MTDRKGERGEKGDHGQQGDEGQRGTRGLTGATGPGGVRGRHGKDTNNPAVWALAFVVMLCFSLLAIGLHRDTQAAHEVHRALCSQRQDDQRRYNGTQKLLAEIPPNTPIVIAGITIPRGTIVRQQQALRAQITALSDVSCG